MGTNNGGGSSGSLTYPDAHYLRRAEGWFELGNLREAEWQLEEISPNQRRHPDVLALRWQMYARDQDWDECLLLALSWTQQSAGDPRAWIALARAFYHKEQIAEAYAVCLARVNDFAKCWELLYDTARYACVLGNRRDAEHYLHLAMTAGDRQAVKLRALVDPVLAPLWNMEM